MATAEVQGCKALHDISETAAFITNKPRQLSIISDDSNSTKTADTAPKALGGLGALMRRKSSLRNVAQSLIGLRRMTIKGRLGLNVEEPAKPKVKYENTYRMEPNEGSVIDMKKVDATVKQNLELYLKDEKYNPVNTPALTCEICTSIKKSVKALNFARYKIVCQVIIGQCLDQGIHAASRNIWDPKTDNFTCVSYQNDSLFAMAVVCATYYE